MFSERQKEIVNKANRVHWLDPKGFLAAMSFYDWEDPAPDHEIAEAAKEFPRIVEQELKRLPFLAAAAAIELSAIVRNKELLRAMPPKAELEINWLLVDATKH